MANYLESHTKYWYIPICVSKIQGPPDDKRVHNSHVIVNDSGDIVEVYRKIHLFDVDVKDGPRLKESEGAIPGDKIAPPVPTPVGNVGLAIVSFRVHNEIDHEQGFF